MKTVNYIVLNLARRNYNVPLIFHKGDANANELRLSLQSEGQTVTLTNAMSATADAVVNSVIVAQGESLTVDTENNVVALKLTKNMLSLAGTLKIDVRITESDELLTAATLIFQVEDSVINGDSRFEPVSPTIAEAIAQVAENTEDIAELQADLQELEAGLPDPNALEYTADKVDQIHSGYTTPIDLVKYPSVNAVKGYVDGEFRKLNAVAESPNLFVLESQTLDGVTVTNNGDGTYTFNGTNTATTLFQAFTLPAGDYTAHIEAVSGTADDQGAIRYGTGSGELWISTKQSEESKSFESPTPVFFRLNHGEFTNWRLKIRIEKNGYVSAVDSVARDGLEGKADLAIAEIVEAVTENNNYFDLNTQTVDGISAVKIDADTYEFTGTSSAATTFPEFYILAGTYIAKVEAVSGTATARAAIRYGEGNGTAWVTDNSTPQPVQLTFNTRTRVFFRLNTGEYSSWRLKITIINVGAEYTAIDYKMREKFAENNEIVTALSGTVSGLELPVNHLSAYNVFTCVDKTKVKLTSATKILAFGDSITHGGNWGTPWVTFLSNIVGCTVSNYAVSGALFGEEVREEAKWISKQISAVTPADWSATTLVVIAAGTNDAGYSTTDSELAAKVQAAITAIKAKTNAPILFITPIKRGSADTDANYNKLPKISGIIENVALKNQCSVICGLNFPIPAHDNGVIENMMGEAGGYIHPNNTGGYVYAMCVIDAVMTQDVPYKTTSITSDSTDEQYPTAKAVYDAIQAAIASLT